MQPSLLSVNSKLRDEFNGRTLKNIRGGNQDFMGDFPKYIHPFPSPGGQYGKLIL